MGQTCPGGGAKPSGRAGSPAVWRRSRAGSGASSTTQAAPWSGRRLGGKAASGAAAARSGPVGEPVRLRTVDEILAVLEQAAGDAMQLDNSAERCRVLTSFAGQALKALEVGELEARLEALEQRANLGRAA